LRTTRARLLNTGCFSRSRGGEGRIAALQFVVRMRGCARTVDAMELQKSEGEGRRFVAIRESGENRSSLERAEFSSATSCTRLRQFRGSRTFEWGMDFSRARKVRGTKVGHVRDLGRKIPGQVYASAWFIREKAQAGWRIGHVHRTFRRSVRLRFGEGKHAHNARKAHARLRRRWRTIDRAHRRCTAAPR